MNDLFTLVIVLLFVFILFISSPILALIVAGMFALGILSDSNNTN